MSLLPVPSRLPARKHLLAAGFGLLGLALMAGAVMTASGLTLPFTSGDPERVRAGSIVVDGPTTTQASTRATTSTTRRPDIPRALDPVAIPGPTGTSPATTTARPAPTTTSTSLPTVPTLLPPIGGLGRGGLG